MAQRSKKTYRPRSRNTSPLERDDQMLLFEWLEYASIQHPELNLAYHIANGGRRDVREARNLRLQGVKAGVPDICIPVAKGRYSALYVELKRLKGGRVSEEQRAWIDALNRVGNLAVVAHGFEEAKNVIVDYLKLGKGDA